MLKELSDHLTSVRMRVLEWLVVLFALPVVFIFWLMNRQLQSGGNNQAINFGKSRARLASDGKRRITFADVAGAEEAVEELKEVVDFLRDLR